VGAGAVARRIPNRPSPGSTPGGSIHGTARPCRAGACRDGFLTLLNSISRCREWKKDIGSGFTMSATNGAAPRLLPQHLADLQKSGLSDGQIAACGFFSMQERATIRKTLRWNRNQADLGDCLAIPFPDADGNATEYIRLKPDRPREAEKNGKPIKYESPKGAPNRAYLPPMTRTVLADVTRPLLIAEGEKKAAKADQEGFACIGLVGVYGFQKKQERDKNGNPIGPRELIDELAKIPWKGRFVSVCYDSDFARNPNVRQAVWHLAETLRRHGAIVRVVWLPEGEADADDKSAKVGLDDFLVAHGPDALHELLDAAQEPTPPESELTPNEASDDPHRLARLYIGERCEHRDGLTLRYWREQWHRWDGSAFRELPDDEIRAELTASAKREMDRINLLAQRLADENRPPPAVQRITKGMIGNVEMALESLTIRTGNVESPAWWDGKDWRRRNLISLSNGLLDLDELFARKTDVLLPHSPHWFSPTCLPYPFDADADCSLWRAFLERNLEGDHGRMAMLQEWFGLSAVADTSRQKFLVLEGEGSNGKSVVCAALEAMLGSENCSHVPLEVFGERFQLTPTIGKLANIASEVGELDKAAEGFLKSFTSGDTMQFDRKHKPPVQAVPTARLVLATNNRPRFSDRSGGLWRRMILMPFRVTIAENDPNRVFGMDKPDWWVASGELPGLLNWALVGLDRLRRNNRFTCAEVCEQALAEYRTENNPARMFLLENCRESTNGQTPCGDLYRAYRTFCESSGYSPLADRSFGKEVKRVFPKVERRAIGGRDSRAYTYCGLDLDQLNGFNR
jgi:putative DNA primase/helicase